MDSPKALTERLHCLRGMTLSTPVTLFRASLRNELPVLSRVLIYKHVPLQGKAEYQQMAAQLTIQ